MGKRFFITGMFRSGTTLLARMLNTHEQIVCASDPYRPLFNLFRDQVAAELEINEIAPYDPLGDYFAKGQINLFNQIQNENFEKKIPESERENLLNKIKSHGKPFSPKIINNLEEIVGENFKEIYINLLENVPKYYGAGTEKWEGTKEVWTTEFVPALADTFPEHKFLLVIRDPRAVAASKNVNDKKYPWLFLIRQWRKLTILSWLYNNNSNFQDRVLLVRYEDLVRMPREISVKICDFLNINLDDKILNPGNFKDGHGDKWLQNTSYENKKVEFNTNSIDKWKKVLSKKEVRFIENLCYFEMNLFDYEFEETDDFKIDKDLIIDPPYIDNIDLVNWIQGFYDKRTKISNINEVAKENTRQEFLLNHSNVLFEQIENKIIQEFFLDVDYFKKLRDLMENYKDE
ncbi:MAG: sulfotransferase family protein [Bacillota bacterium]